MGTRKIGKGKKATYVSDEYVSLDDCSVERLKEIIADAESRLSDVSFEVYAEDHWGSPTAICCLVGKRPATAQEIASYEEAVERQKKARAFHLDQKERELRAARPELFK